jgi:hypothetical protein
MNVPVMKWHKKYGEDLKRDMEDGKINYCQRCKLEEEPCVVLHGGP